LFSNTASYALPAKMNAASNLVVKFEVVRQEAERHGPVYPEDNVKIRLKIVDSLIRSLFDRYKRDKETHAAELMMMIMFDQLYDFSLYNLIIKSWLI